MLQSKGRLPQRRSGSLRSPKAKSTPTMGGGGSVPATQVTSNLSENRLETNGYRLADFHSNFHSSGLCVAGFVVIVLLIGTLFYCFRKRICPQHFSRSPEAHTPMYPRQPQTQSPSIISNIRRSIHRSTPDKGTEWSPNQPNV